jgi:uncharacterized phage protein (TIGR02220 family)
LKWFKHFTKALTDAKIEKLIMKYGIEGYGLYFACLEIIAGNLTSDNITFELEHDAEILAYKFKMDTLKVNEIMLYCVELGLFEYNKATEKIMCLKLLKYIDDSTSKNPEIRKIVTNSEKLRIIPKDSAQTRLDKTRLDKNINNNKKTSKEVFILNNKEAEEIADYYHKNMKKFVRESNINNVYKEKAIKIIDYLNQKTNRKYGKIDSHIKPISNRLKDGYTEDDCKYVIDVKYQEWKGTDFEKFLTPTTLFRPSNFDKYRNQKASIETRKQLRKR